MAPHYVLRKDLEKIQDTSTWPSWLLDAETIDPIVNIIGKKIIWKDGTWVCGSWCGDEWEYGIWLSGSWNSGTWYDGLWKYGIIMNGSFLSGEIHNCVCFKSVFEEILIKDGVFFDLKFTTKNKHTLIDGTYKSDKILPNKVLNIKPDELLPYKEWPDWLKKADLENPIITNSSDGIIFLYGKWNYGHWKGYLWSNGIWEDGIWEDGIWKNGIWKYGHWKKGIWMHGYWKDGIWEDGTWIRGCWKSGAWNKGLNMDICNIFGYTNPNSLNKSNINFMRTYIDYMKEV